MTYIFFIVLSLVSGAYADTGLDNSIKVFQLEAMPPTPTKREALFMAGQNLFHNKILSAKGNISCVSCHSPQGASADALPLGIGEGGEGFGKERHQSQGAILDRHTMALFNLGVGNIQNYMWDSRIKRNFRGFWTTPEPGLNGPNPRLSDEAATFDSLLAVQAIFPIANHLEMAGQESTMTNTEAWSGALKRVIENRVISGLLREAYPEAKKINIAHIGNALAEFERHEFVSDQTPWDLYIRGQKQHMNPKMIRGAKIFIGKANCIFCHQGEHLSTFGTQNIGVPQLKFADQGEAAIDPRGFNDFAFRIAPLRNVGITAPYMHSGVFSDLREVIEHYNEPAASFENFKWKGAGAAYREEISLFTDPEFMRQKSQHITAGLKKKLDLTAEEKEDLHCFLKVALTDLRYQKRLSDDIVDCAPIF
jgi:cytochrome c peroxidase